MHSLVDLATFILQVVRIAWLTYSTGFVQIKDDLVIARGNEIPIAENPPVARLLHKIDQRVTKAEEI